MTDSSKYLTPQELAKYMNVPLGTIFSKTSRGELPVTRLGRRIPRYRVADIEAWLKERTTTPGGAS
jgi:excisionase family DNA binding protein